jgi:hypothetical protein
VTRLGQNEMTPKRGMPLHVRLTKGFGLAASQGGLLPAADMPDRQYINCARRDAVVDEVPDAPYQQAPDAREACSSVFGADSGLLSQECEALPNVISDRTGSRRSVLSPPFCGCSDLLGSACGDSDAERHVYPCLRMLSRTWSADKKSPPSTSVMAASNSSSSS